MVLLAFPNARDWDAANVNSVTDRAAHAARPPLGNDRPQGYVGVSNIADRPEEGFGGMVYHPHILVVP